MRVKLLLHVHMGRTWDLFDRKAWNLSKKEVFGGLSKWEGHMTCLSEKAWNI